jgi:hypothetical protein
LKLRPPASPAAEESWTVARLKAEVDSTLKEAEIGEISPKEAQIEAEPVLPKIEEIPPKEARIGGSLNTRRSEIAELAASMLNRGIAREIARRTGLSEVRQLLPKKFKLEEFIHPPTSGRRLEEKAETIPSEVEKPKPDLGKVEASWLTHKPSYDISCLHLQTLRRFCGIFRLPGLTSSFSLGSNALFTATTPSAGSIKTPPICE